MADAETYPFLSPQWIDAVAAIRDEYLDRVGPPTLPLRANLLVTGAPFAESEIRGFLDSTGGALSIELGQLDTPDLSAALDYDTARRLFVEQDLQAVMQAVFGGKIRLTGDVTRLLALQPPSGDSPETALAGEIAARVRAITS